MTGLLNLIAQYSSKLNILPVIVAMNIIITILIHFLSKRKIVKFFPSFTLGIISILLLIYSLNIFTSPHGLDLTWIAVFLGTSALVGIFTCFIIDLIKSIRSTNLELNNNEVYVAQKTRTDKKRKDKNNSRVAKKSSKDHDDKKSSSKYYTKKIKANPNGEVKASEKINTKDVIIFESEEE